MAHFNQLTPGEQERLAILMEECAEVIQIAGKILRHGYESYNPNDSRKTTNRELLEKEIGHVHFAYLFMDEAEDIRLSQVRDMSRLKNLKIGRWLHHQGTSGYGYCSCGSEGCCQCNPW